MDNEFVPSREALILRQLGFKEQCLGNYRKPNSRFIYGFELAHTPVHVLNIDAPLYQQTFDWFRKVYGKHVLLFSDGYQWTFDIRWVDKEDFDEYPHIHYPTKEVKRKMFDTFEEARLESIRVLISLTKN